MANTSSSKKFLVLCAGIAVFSVAFWLNISNKNAEIVESLPRDKLTRTARNTTTSVGNDSMKNVVISAQLRKSNTPTNNTDIFTSRSWLVLPPSPPPPQPIRALPPAPPPLPAVAPKPVAPPLPFSFIGTLDEKGKARQVFLSKGDQLLVVKSTDVVDATYRIDQITDTSVVITYLPLNQQQTLPIQQGGS